MKIRRLVDLLGRFLIRLLLRVDIIGQEHIPAAGPVILMPNHINWVDVSVVFVLMPRQPAGMAKEELLRVPLIGALLKGCGIIPVKRGEVDRVALRRAQELLSAGQRTLMIAPEGHRSGSGALQAGHNGLAFIAIRSHAWIVPIAVTGVQPFWRNVFSLRKTTITVRIGRCFRFTDNGDKIDRNTLHLMTQEAMYQLAVLLPEDHRGAYADIGQATTSHLEFAK